MTERVQHQILNNATTTATTSYPNVQHSMVIPHAQAQQQQSGLAYGGHSSAHCHRDGSAIPPKLRGKRRATTPASSDLEKQILPSTSTTTPTPAFNAAVFKNSSECSPASSGLAESTPSSAMLLVLQQQQRSQAQTSSIVSPGSPSSIVQSAYQQVDQAYRSPKTQKIYHQQQMTAGNLPVSGSGITFANSQPQRHQLAPIVIPTPRHYHQGQGNQILLTTAGKRHFYNLGFLL